MRTLLIVLACLALGCDAKTAAGSKPPATTPTPTAGSVSAHASAVELRARLEGETLVVEVVNNLADPLREPKLIVDMESCGSPLSGGPLRRAVADIEPGATHTERFDARGEAEFPEPVITRARGVSITAVKDDKLLEFKQRLESIGIHIACP